MNAASHVESPISGRKLCAFALAAALALMAGAQFAPAHYAWAEDEPAATAQADATLPDAAPLEEAPPEVAALAPIENAPHLDLKDGSILLKDSGSNLQYSQDNEATWTSYSGNVTIGGTAGSGTNVQVLNGTHTILLNGVTINEPRANHAAIEIGSDTQAAQLTLWLYGSNKLSGSSGYPAIFAPGKAHLIFKGDLYGSLEAQGGYEAPAIGADSAVSSCGTIEFWQPGNVTARSGNGAPALGDPTSSAVDATGSVSFFSGTVTLQSSGTCDITAKSIVTGGGNIHLSQRPPANTTLAVDQGGSFPSSAYVLVSGLAAGENLLGASFGEKGPVFVRGDRWVDAKHYIVDGFATWMDDGDLGLFLDRNLLKDGSSVKMSFSESGNVYEGTIKGSAEAGYTLHLAIPDPPVENPVVSMHEKKGCKLIVDVSSEGIPQYTLDGGVSWTRYSGYLAVTGAADFTSFPVSNQVIVRKGTHALRFQDLSGVAVSIEGSSNATLTLVGSNYICGHRLEASPGVAVRGTSSLTINGKGTLNTVGAGTGRQPCILGEPNTTISIAGGTVLAHSGVTGGNGITAGKLVVSGGTVEALSQSSGSAAITASKSITISGGSVTAKGSKFVAGIGSDHYGSCGSITISGGIVNAHGGDLSAAIGCSVGDSCGEIKISGGTINAVGGPGTYGAGRVAAITSSVKAPVITGGTVKCNEAVSTRAASLASASASPAPAALNFLLASPVALASDLDEEATSLASEDEQRFVNENNDDLSLVTIHGLPANTPISSLQMRLLDTEFVEEPTGGSTYGMRDVQTDDQGALYLHLTPLEATDKLVVASWNGRNYSGLSERNLDGTFAIALAPTEAAVYYQWHSFEDGWAYEDAGVDWSIDGQTSGNAAGHDVTALRIETSIGGLNVSYAVDNGSGWSPAVENGDIAGEMEQPVQALRVSLSGDEAARYTVYYRLYVKGVGWMAWAHDGTANGTSGYGYPVKAFQVAILPAGATPTTGEASATEYAYLVKDGQSQPGLIGEKPSAGHEEREAAPPAKALASTGDSPAFAIALGAALASGALVLASRARHRRSLS